MGESLAVDTSPIADANGLDDVSFSYQWPADDAEIDGATEATHMPVAADLTKSIKVRVSFSWAITVEPGSSGEATVTSSKRRRPQGSATASADTHRESTWPAIWCERESSRPV